MYEENERKKSKETKRRRSRNPLSSFCAVFVPLMYYVKKFDGSLDRLITPLYGYYKDASEESICKKTQSVMTV